MASAKAGMSAGNWPPISRGRAPTSGMRTGSPARSWAWAALSAALAQLRAGYPVRMPLVGAKPREIAGQFPADIAAFTDALLRVAFDSPYGYEQVLTLMLARFNRTGGAVLVTPRLTTRIADMAMRMQQSGVATRLIWISDDDREESMTLIERMKMGGVAASRLDPWENEAGRGEQGADEQDGRIAV